MNTTQTTIDLLREENASLHTALQTAHELQMETHKARCKLARYCTELQERAQEQDARIQALEHALKNLVDTQNCGDCKNDGWIEWHGGEGPVPDETPVYIRLRSGRESGYAHPAGSWAWHHCGDYSNGIIAYRLAK
jgi:hypothetical protein